MNLLAELRDHNTQAAHLVLKPPSRPNQAESVIRVRLPDRGDTLVFQGEEGDLPVFSNQTSQALQELWQIQPGTLKCKKKANGELFKLGTGRQHLSMGHPCISSPIKQLNTHF